jgi:hypothetical protein
MPESKKIKAGKVFLFSQVKICDTINKKYNKGEIAVSIDVLQEKIRKTRNPSVLVLEAYPDSVPPMFREETATTAKACCDYYLYLLAQLKGIVPAVRKIKEF